MSFCWSCGAKARDGDRFCDACGERVDSMPAGTPAVESPRPSPTDASTSVEQPRRGRRYLRRGALPAVVVLIAAAVGVGAAGALRGGGTSAQQNISATRVHLVAPPVPLPTTSTIGFSATGTSSVPGVLALAAQPGLPPNGKDIAGEATVSGPKPPPVGSDDPPGSRGFSLRSTVDGTAPGWRVPGDAANTTITLEFPQPVTIRAVGMDPGDDAQDASGNDLWWTRRLITQATFIFDNGTRAVVTFDTNNSFGPSTLATTERLQLGYLGAPETTSTIRLHIDETTAAEHFDQTFIRRIAVLAA